MRAALTLMLICLPYLYAFSQAYVRRDTLMTAAQKQKFKQNKAKFDSIFDGFATFMKSEKVLIRKTFDATSKDEEKPAAFLWNKDYQSGNGFYLTADIGVKSKDFQLFKGAPDLFLFSPKFEWHRDNTAQQDKRKNNIGGGINVTIIPLKGVNWAVRPFINGSLDYKKDFIKDLQTFSAKGYLSGKGKKNLSPGATIRWSGENPVLRYYPYAGYEYYTNIEKSRQSAHMLVGRIFTEFWPVPPFADYIQLTAEYTGRYVLSNTLYEKTEGLDWAKGGNLSWLTLGINFYVNANNNVGIGLDYSKGYDPTSNFVKTNKIAMGFKLKF